MFAKACLEYRDHDGGAFHQAFDNLEADLGVGGNITVGCKASLNRMCAPTPGSFRLFEALIGLHQAYRTCACAAATARRPKLFRVVSRRTFRDWHFANGGNRNAATPPKGRRKSAHNRTPLASLPASFPNSERYLPEQLLGGTGNPETASWWSFDPPLGLSEPGRRWFSGLALPEDGRKNAVDEGLSVIEIVDSVFPRPVYKPTALDGFCARSKFRPERGGADHGWTNPDDPGNDPPFKELVSESFEYRLMAGSGAEIEVTHLPW